MWEISQGYRKAHQAVWIPNVMRRGYGFQKLQQVVTDSNCYGRRLKIPNVMAEGEEREMILQAFINAQQTKNVAIFMAGG